jgi:hypothetical protein
MPQTLNGHAKWITRESLGVSVGIFRAAIGNWNFTDDTGATAAYTLFTATGDVYIQQIYGACKVVPVGAGTIEVGIAGNTAVLIAQTTGTDLLQYGLWQDATPEANPGIITLLARSWLLQNGADIIFTIAGAVLTAGDIDFYCNYIPLSPDATLVAA